MNRLWIVLGLAAAVFFSGTVSAGERWILKLKQPAALAQQAVAASVVKAGGKVNHSFKLIPAEAIELPAPALLNMLQNPVLAALVERVEKDAVGTARVKR